MSQYLDHSVLTMRRIYTIIILTIFLFSLACSKSGSSAASLSNDDKHRLYQAAINTRDSGLIQQVTQSLGLSGSNGSQTPAFNPFTKEHVDWSSKNFDFVKEYIAPEKAKEYVNSHLPK